MLAYNLIPSNSAKRNEDAVNFVSRGRQRKDFSDSKPEIACYVSSLYVPIRGSYELLWGEKNDLRYVDVFINASETFGIQNIAVNSIPQSEPEVHKELVSIPEMIDKIEFVFGFNATQLAKILKISRASFYNHRSVKEAPSNYETYEKWYRLADSIFKIGNASIKTSIKTVLINGKTLYELISTEEISDEKIYEYAIKIIEKQSPKIGAKTTLQQRLSIFTS